MRNPYKVLKIPRSATEADIKKSFRQLAKKLHPDANKSDPTAAERFAELNSAYEILSNEQTRKAFDRGKIDSDGRPTGPEIARRTPRRPIVTGLMIAVMLAATSTLVIRGRMPRAEINANGDGRDAISPSFGTDEEHVSAQRIEAVDRIAQPEPRVVMQQIELLIGRSQKLISEGDIAAGRALLQRAAEVDNARAAFALGATYDPVMLTILGANSVAADVSLARDWYKKASELGSQEAQERLKLLASASIGVAAVPRKAEPGIAVKDTVTPVTSAKPRNHVTSLPSRVNAPANDPNGVYVAGERVGTDPDPNIRTQLLRDDAGWQLHTSAAAQ